MSTPAEPTGTIGIRLDDTTSDTLTLPSGRKLGYAQYGAPNGTPILYMHGFPSSRLEGAMFEPIAHKLGARIIAIDRPGFGLSSPPPPDQPPRTLLSAAQDVHALTQHLGLRRYGVLGISGGGPYALACAKALPAEELRAVCIVCGIGSPDMGYRGMQFPNYLGWTYGQRWLPGLVRWWFGRQPDARLDLSDEERLRLMRRGFEKEKAGMHPKDVAFFGDENWMKMRLRLTRETYAQGLMGMSDDYRVLNSDFGFRIEDIRKDLPVQVWHGDKDVFAPTRHGREVAKRLGDNATLHITDDTHASISKDRQEGWMGDLVKAIRG
ncbi:uncharacterized protein HMPREF1541_02963 [Cyphellophora europaea CBS 101466]|uniref:AB hydrolase-1 domain-containing protein n=1 Tax=Cyphellophora europaea (strain CBS 101466) TaxID=1220924 RepID=W2RZC4_CYPE1|nr:uncharacterized protein HMPREF1541_02963 [Cyphellophora europaea CBS 101466]ETN41029.1 hypothetical protein HMPREF1541_02963 [Cyphellophora europaea CBS 101466]